MRFKIFTFLTTLLTTLNMYSQTCFEGIVRDFNGTPISGVTVEIEIIVFNKVTRKFKHTPYPCEKATTGDGKYYIKTPSNPTFDCAIKAHDKSGNYYFEPRSRTVLEKETKYSNTTKCRTLYYDIDMSPVTGKTQIIAHAEREINDAIGKTRERNTKFLEENNNNPRAIEIADSLTLRLNELEENSKREIQRLRAELGNSVSIEKHLEVVDKIKDKYILEIDSLKNRIYELEVENRALKLAFDSLLTEVKDLKKEVFVRSLKAGGFNCLGYTKKSINFSFNLQDKNGNLINEHQQLYVVIYRVVEEDEQPLLIRYKNNKEFMPVQFNGVNPVEVNFESQDVIFKDKVFNRSGYIVFILNEYFQTINSRPIIYIDTLKGSCKIKIIPAA